MLSEVLLQQASGLTALRALTGVWCYCGLWQKNAKLKAVSSLAWLQMQNWFDELDFRVARWRIVSLSWLAADMNDKIHQSCFEMCVPNNLLGRMNALLLFVYHHANLAQSTFLYRKHFYIKSAFNLVEALVLKWKPWSDSSQSLASRSDAGHQYNETGRPALRGEHSCSAWCCQLLG